MRPRAFSAPLSATNFRPRFPSKIPTYPSGLIANTDRNNKLGQHWVAMFFPDEENKEEFFDSYGLPPNFYTPRFTKFLASHPGDTERNVGTLQALNSTVCGYYCMFYLFHRSRRQDFKSIVKRLVWTTLKPTIVVVVCEKRFCSTQEAFVLSRGLRAMYRVQKTSSTLYLVRLLNKKTVS